MRDIIAELKNMDPKEYTSIPFWSWNNKLEEKELLSQIHEMKKGGMRGFMIHARNGLEVEYLSEQWFHLVEVCLDEAKKLDMQVLIYDEHGWPSGFAGGRLLKNPENRARYLSYKIQNAFDENAFAVFALEKGTARRIIKSENGLQEYHCIYLKTSPANTDILNPQVVKQFLDIVYEAYYSRFADRFGKELAGFFTDEPQYYRYETPYTPVAEQIWRERYGEDIRDGLLYLFILGEQGYVYRTRYYRLLNELYTLNYYKKLNDWCEERHCIFCGHSIEENNLCRQMWGGAAVTPTYEYETIPTIDHLGRVPSAKLSARQVGSAAAQLGKKRVLTESFCGTGWDCTPGQLRLIGESQYVRGVNMTCQHLISYSLKGQGKQDYPPSFGRNNTWSGAYPAFNQYFDRLGYLLINSREITNVVVINPMASVYLNYIRLDEGHVKELDEKMSALIDLLDESGISWHLADETILSRHGKVEKGRFLVGECEYQHVILPYCLSLFESTKKLLEEFVEQGGKVYLFDEAPLYTEGRRDDYGFLKKKKVDNNFLEYSGAHLKEKRDENPLEKQSENFNEDLKKKTRNMLNKIKTTEKLQLQINGRIPYTYRDLGDYRLIYLLNEGDKSGTCILPDDNFAVLDLDHLTLEEADSHLTLLPGESKVLLQNYPLRDQIQKKQNSIYELVQNITEEFHFTEGSRNGLPLDLASISKDGVHFDEPHLVYEICERLIKESYEGELWIKQTFETEEICENMSLLLENSGQNDLTLNGSRLYPESSGFDPLFVKTDITKMIKCGENELKYRIFWHRNDEIKTALFDPDSTESVSNCLAFENEIEPVYLLGDFKVSKERIIRKSDNGIDIKDITGSGYAYFCGNMKFTAKVTGMRENVYLAVNGDYMVYSVTVNGKTIAENTFSQSVPVKLIPQKENTIELTLTSSMRNLFGPYHVPEQPECTSPDCFTMRGSWENGESPLYRKEYATVPFGVKSVLLEYRDE